MSDSTIVVAGATGNLGGRITNALLASARSFATPLRETRSSDSTGLA
jgi:uncharacterized protein YbjT (DUF2867 family)